MNTTLMPIPKSIPISNGKTKHAMNAARPGTKSDSVLDDNRNCKSEMSIIRHYTLAVKQTFAAPHRLDHFHFDHEKYGSDYHSS